MTQEEQDAIDRVNEIFADANTPEPEPPAPVVSTAVSVLPPRTLAHVLDKDTAQLAAEFDRMDANRKLFLQWLYNSLVEDVDFGRIHVVSKDKCPNGKHCTNPGHFSKPELFKPGAEKIAGKLTLIPEFPDLERYVDSAVDGKEIKSIILRCQLKNTDGLVVGTGIGARTLGQDYGDLNKSLKMCKKSAFVDSILGCGGISEIFTVDISDMMKDQEKAARLESQVQTQLPPPPPPTAARPAAAPRFVDPPPPAAAPAYVPTPSNTIALPDGPEGVFLHAVRSRRRGNKMLTDGQLRALWAITNGQGAALLQLDTKKKEVTDSLDDFLHWMFNVQSNRDIHIENAKAFLDTFMRGANSELFVALWKLYLEA